MTSLQPIMSRRGWYKVIPWTLMLLISASVFGTLPGAAQESTPSGQPEAEVQIALRPTDGVDGDRFTVELAPGESATLSATMQNFAPTPVGLITYTANVVPVVNGGLSVEDELAVPAGPTLWMSYPTEEFTLQSGEAKVREFQVTVPEGTAPGQYVNALVLKTTESFDDGGSFAVYYSKTVSVYITVPGEVVSQFDVQDPSFVVNGQVVGIVVPVVNTGNVRLDLTGSITILDETGAIFAEIPVRMGVLYGGFETVIAYRLAAIPPPGSYTVSIELTDEASGQTGGWSDRVVQMEEDVAAGNQPYEFANVVVEGNAEPIQFATVSVDVNVLSSAPSSSRLVLVVSHNGQEVEEFVLGENLALNVGTTTVQQRYIPITGWQSGTYEFGLRLESTEGGSSQVIAEEDAVATLEVP